MTTFVPMASPARQPFGSIVDSPRLRNLANVKNRQNAIPQLQPGSLKRRHPTTEISDSENMDPSSLKYLSKRKRSDVDDDMSKPSKPAPFAVKVITSTKQSTTVHKRAETPRTHTPSNSISLPVSAPPAAGRSPKAKNRVGILNRRRTTSTPFKRIDPPVFAKPTSNGGFSIAAALSGTKPSYAPKPAPVRTIEESMPNSWMFEIHEDTEYDELNNLLGHSTQTLDISDDESKAEDKNDRGKENVPPAEHAFVTAAPSTRNQVTRKNMMTEEPRAPLGDLEASEFYADGCDESSFFVYPPDDKPKANATLDANIGLMAKPDIAALIQAIAPEDVQPKVEFPKVEDGGDLLPEATEAEIEIWESGSAAEEAEGGSPRENIFDL